MAHTLLYTLGYNAPEHRIVAMSLVKQPAPGVTTRAASEAERLHDAMRFFGSDSNEFRHRLDRMLADFETLRRRYEQVRTQHHDAERQNEKLVAMLQEAKQQIELLKEEVDKLCAPPNGYGVFIRSNKDSTAEIIVDGNHGQIILNPSANVRREFAAILQNEKRLEQELEKLRDAAALTPGRMLKLSRPGFKVVMYDSIEEFYLAEALEYITAGRQSTPDNPVGICGPIGPTEQLALVERFLNGR